MGMDVGGHVSGDGCRWGCVSGDGCRWGWM